MVGKIRGCFVAAAATLMAGWSVQPAWGASETVTFVFPPYGLGYSPEYALTSVGDVLYGINFYAGSRTLGTAYTVTQGTARFLHAFKGRPSSALLDVKGVLYGVTSTGGTSTNCSFYGCGSIYRLSPDGSYKTVYSFQGGAGGDYPQGKLVDIGGTLYGVTSFGGGTGCGGSGCGTVFSISPYGDFKTIYVFGGGVNGRYPNELITDGATLYGTTSAGGVVASCVNQVSSGCGTVFSMTPSGVRTTIYAFPDAAHGTDPTARLLKIGDALFGTTGGGGALGYGTVFEVSLSGAYRQIHAFSSASDGGAPFTGLTALGATLYGSTFRGGAANAGQIYAVDSRGDWSVVYTFKGGMDGAVPSGELIARGAQLVGVTALGGSDKCGRPGCGTIYTFTP